MLNLEEAFDAITHYIEDFPRYETENVTISESATRILSEDVRSSLSVPPEDNSAMDGYALHSDSVSQIPCNLKITQRICAGDKPGKLIPGSAARIFTGAPIPEGANCVIMQENCESIEDTVTLKQAIHEFDNIRRAGQDIRENEVILKKGTRLDARHIGLIASIGRTEVNVYRKVKVAIFSTGNELLESGQAPQKGKIFDSNRPMIEQLCRDLGCDVVSSFHIKDSLDATKTAFAEAAKRSDIIMSCGGVSVGEEDHVKTAVKALGQLNLWKVKIKPGKPFAFGKINSTVFIGLPGNPVSAFVTFFLFGQMIIKQLQGRTDASIPSYRTRACFTIPNPGTRAEFVRVQLRDDGAHRFSNQSSGVLTSVSWADALAFVPENQTVAKGDWIDVYPL